MSNIKISGPNSWDRDMQGLDEEEESENLTALGMHLAGDDDEEEEEEDEEALEADKPVVVDDDEEEEETEEIDELKELARLEKELKEEDAPKLTDEEE